MVSDSGPSPAPPTAREPWSGSLTRKVTSTSHAVATGDGPLSLTITYSKAESLTLSVLDAGGGVVRSATVRSGDTLSPSVVAGTYTVVVSGAAANFTVAATYTAP